MSGVRQEPMNRVIFDVFRPWGGERRKLSISSFHRLGFDRLSDYCYEIDIHRSRDAEQGFQGRIPHFAFHVAHHLL